MESGCLRIQFQCFGANFAYRLDRCTLNRGAFALKIVRGTLKWRLKGGSRLIEVTPTAGLTVLNFFISVSDQDLELYYQFSKRIDIPEIETESSFHSGVNMSKTNCKIMEKLTSTKIPN